ncbi:MAG: hypothetical protein JOY69_03260, partial [Candidatus Eremiobacteraeota bacterium]|nr:hypothetical protein [Candidatus Eremiobacteraeota bacterium]
MFGLRTSSAFVVAAAFVAGLTGCAGNQSLLPVGGSKTATALRGGPTHRGIARLAHQPPVGMQMAFLMTDGTVLTQSYAGNTWYRYAPDANGGYGDGTWTEVASLPSGYDPSAFA